MTHTTQCDHCGGEGWEPTVAPIDGDVEPLDSPVPCRSCLGQRHVEVDEAAGTLAVTGPLADNLVGRTDTERLDALERLLGGRWVTRISPHGRGFRLHQSFSGDHTTYGSPRSAIDAWLDAR